MTNCSKCSTKIYSHLWVVDGIVYCSAFCERSEYDHKTKKYSTRNHRYGDSKVKNIGIAGLKQKQ